MKKLILRCSHFLLFNAFMALGQGVDLDITSITMRTWPNTTDTLFDDHGLWVDVCYKNHGTQDINADLVKTVFYISIDSILDPSDKILFKSHMTSTAIVAGGTWCGEAARMFPHEGYLFFHPEMGGRLGRYYIIADVDPTQEIVESDTANNTFTKPITVIERDAKITIEIDSVWSDPSIGKNTIRTGESFNMTVSAYNRGSMISRLINGIGSIPNIALYRDTTQLPVTGFIENMFGFGRLEPNYIGPKLSETNLSSYNEKTMELIAPDYLPGNYYIGIEIWDLVEEVPAFRRRAYLPITLENPFYRDLSLTRFNVDKTSLQIGEGINVSATIKNLGNADAGPFNMAYAISDDTIYNDSDRRLRRNSLNGLTAGDSIVDEQYLSITDAISPGNYFLIAKVNHNEQVLETELSNNTLIIPISIGVVTDVSSAMLNDQVTIFPNPSTGEVHILNRNTENVDLKVYDLSNRLVYAQNAVVQETQLSLQNGVYIVRISSGNRTLLTEKLIVNK